jgi:hypothetical protein
VALLGRAVHGDCRLRIVQRREDGSVAVRLPAGGAGLLRVSVRARYEATGGAAGGRAVPATALLRLDVTDSLGRLRLEHRLPLALRRRSNDDDMWWTLASRLHLRLPQRQSVRVRVGLPERLDPAGLELEWLELDVADGTVVPGAVDVLPVPVPDAARLGA